MNFNQAVEIILRHEGGYVNHPKDPGGETNFGICKRSHPGVDIKNLTKEKAIEIYLKNYWENINLHLLPPGLNLLVFDCAVNQGCSFAVKALQEAVNVAVTGRLKFSDIEKLDDLDIATIIERYAQIRLKRYSSNVNFPVFGQGWTKRLLYTAVLAVISLKKE